jgi:uncharacterized protein YcaQ
LPILWGRAFAGRMDAKISRKSGVLSLQHLQLDTTDIDALLVDLIPALQAFLSFNQGTEISLKHISAPQQVTQVQRHFLRQKIELITLN